MRRAQATEAIESPREVAEEPRRQGHDGEEHGDRERDDDDELLDLRAEVRDGPAGSGECLLGDVADLRSHERDAGQRRPEVAAALDHRLPARPDRSAPPTPR